MEFLFMLFFSVLRSFAIPPVGPDIFPQHFILVSFMYSHSSANVQRPSVTQCKELIKQHFRTLQSLRL